MGVISEILEENVSKASKFKSIEVNKPIDVDYDLGNLLVIDGNELDQQKILSKDCDDYILNLTRDNVQLLVNQIWTLETERRDEVIVAKLPEPTFPLPRSRPIPKPKKPTKWEQFAKAKGIQKKKKSKLSWDETLKRWVPLYGYRKNAAEAEKNWVIEVPQNADPYEDQFAKKQEVKSEKVAKNEFQRLRNIASGVKIPRTGVMPQIGSSKDLNIAATIAKSSTASLGKFQETLPKEKLARGVSEVLPGASRKRKMTHSGGAETELKDNVRIFDEVLKKRPKINVEKAVERSVGESEIRNRRKNKKNDQKKKPKGKKGERKGKNSGRKRR
nr:ribosome biogenesis regulatory protein homolog [Onthophagus taurus]